MKEMSCGKQERTTRWRPLILSLTVLTTLISPSVKAYTCEFTDLFTRNETREILGLNISTVGEDVPVGKVLYRTEVSRDLIRSGYYCGIKSPSDLPAVEDPDPYYNVYNILEVASIPSGAPTNSGGRDIFPTNVPGIGVTFAISGALYESTQFPAEWRNEKISIIWGAVVQGFGVLSTVTIELVKTGPIPPGTQQVMGSSFPTFRVRAGSTHPQVIENTFLNLSFGGTTTMFTKTCQLATANIDVDLGKHEVQTFDGVGSGSPWKDFDIVLKDCPPFYGYGDYRYKDWTTPQLTGANTPNDVAISFRSANGVVDGNPNLAKLKEGPGTAAGVGIEVAQRTLSTSIPLDGTGGFTLENLPKEENTTYTIPLKARYVQSEPTVQAGLANGAVEFTITYQ